jgi:hypothetical protein
MGLIDADGIVGAEHRHGAPEPDAARCGGRCCEEGPRGRDRHAERVVLTDAEEVGAHLFGQTHPLQQIADRLGSRRQGSVAPARTVPEAVDAELHLQSLFAEADSARGRRAESASTP